MTVTKMGYAQEKPISVYDLRDAACRSSMETYFWSPCEYLSRGREV